MEQDFFFFFNTRKMGLKGNQIEKHCVSALVFASACVLKVAKVVQAESGAAMFRPSPSHIPDRGAHRVSFPCHINIMQLGNPFHNGISRCGETLPSW